MVVYQLSGSFSISAKTIIRRCDRITSMHDCNKSSKIGKQGCVLKDFIYYFPIFKDIGISFSTISAISFDILIFFSTNMCDLVQLRNFDTNPVQFLTIFEFLAWSSISSHDFKFFHRTLCNFSQYCILGTVVCNYS